jgi:tryptophan-rich sensory protein
MNDSTSWYQNLKKPDWAPEPSLFGQVWTPLYVIIFVVNAYVFKEYVDKQISWLVALPFWINLFANVIFTPIQFGLRNNYLALLDIMLILATIVWSMIAIWPHNKLISLAFVPYLVWVTIATVLQFQITLLNR